MNLMEGWLEEERQGTVNTEPPPLPPYLEVKGDVLTAEVAQTEVPKQPPLVDAEDEVVDSNSPPTTEEPANQVTSGYVGSNTLINLKEGVEPAAIVNNDPSLA